MSRVSPDNVFLGLLKAQSCHGYQLLEHFRQPEALGHIWNLSTSQLYALLKRLENAELIDGREEASDNAPMRTVYWLTDAGRAQFEAWFTDPEPSASTRAIRTEFLSRLYLAQLLQRPAEPLIVAQRASCEAHQAKLARQRDKLANGPGCMALDLRVREMTTILQWLAALQSNPVGE